MIRPVIFGGAMVLASLGGLATTPVQAQQYTQTGQPADVTTEPAIQYRNIPGLPRQFAQSGGLSDAEIDRRIQFLEDRLDAARSHGQWWHWGWLSVNTASAVGFTAAAAATSDHDDTVNYAVNAAKATIGLTRMLIDPLEARLGADPVRGMPTATREQRLAKLQAAENQLLSNAERADERWSWQAHAGNAALAGIAAGVVAAWAETGAAIEVGVGGLIGGIAFILTQPARPRDDWDDYQRLTGRKSTTELDVDFFVAQQADATTLNMRLSW